MTGIYKITSPSNNIYIGQSINIEKRKILYKNLLCKDQPRIYNSLKKYGFEKHNFEIIQECNPEQLNNLEKYYVDLYQTFNSKHGLNLKDGGGSNGAMADETKRKISESNKGKIRTKEQKLRLSILNKGKKPSEESREKMRKAQKGRKHSEETRKKISDANKGKQPMLGKKHSEATRQKMSLSAIGNKNSLGNKNNLGKKTSEDVKRKLSIANKLYWQRKKYNEIGASAI